MKPNLIPLLFLTVITQHVSILEVQASTNFNFKTHKQYILVSKSKEDTLKQAEVFYRLAYSRHNGNVYEARSAATRMLKEAGYDPNLLSDWDWRDIRIKVRGK